MGRSRKPVYGQPYRGFESLPLRWIPKHLRRIAAWRDDPSGSLVLREVLRQRSFGRIHFGQINAPATARATTPTMDHDLAVTYPKMGQMMPRAASPHAAENAKAPRIERNGHNRPTPHSGPTAAPTATP